MKLLFLGTGAADWNIAQKAQYFAERGEFRRFSSTLIDDCLLVDPGPHIFDFERDGNYDDLYKNVKTVLITHSHGDHFSPNTVRKLADTTGCTFFGDAACLSKLSRTLESIDGICFKVIGTTETFTDNGYTFISCHSNHSTPEPGETTRNYTIIAPDGKKLFYGLDSGPFRCESWDAIRKSAFDAAILECTTGDLLGDDRIFGHSSLPWILYSLHTMYKQGMLKENAKVIIDHMARTLHDPQPLLEQRIRESGSNITVAYDGYCVEI